MEPQREWFEKDYYKILGVAEDASASDVSKAYRKLAKKLHPDANPGDQAVEERFKEVASAYDVLGDDSKRKAYDEVRRLGPMAGSFGPGGSGPAGGFNLNFEQMGDLGDLFGGLFGRRRGGNPAQRGADIETEVKLEFADAVSGTTIGVPVTGEARCRTCKGLGTKPPTKPQPCPTCSGTGVNDENQGLFSFSRPCVGCAGRGTVIENPCAACGGRGTERRRHEVKARIPAGVTDGQRIKL
ncbi:MAG: DnaJ domain-containing protein, partial [Acidimicrobiaceae bacterium]|nr:DnaJ domain-containing protein [Acidimicrobiaceae bacterium]